MTRVAVKGNISGVDCQESPVRPGIVRRKDRPCSSWPHPFPDTLTRLRILLTVALIAGPGVSAAQLPTKFDNDGRAKQRLTELGLT
jgi:hypothetical protein